MTDGLMDLHEIRMWGLLRLNPLSLPRYLEHMKYYRPEAETYFPTYNRVIRSNRGARPRSPSPKFDKVPVYPGYLFVRLNRDLRMFLDTPVRVYFVRFGMNGEGKGGHISVVREDVIDELKRKEAMEQLVVETTKIDPYNPGRCVRIHTPIASINGIIVMCTQAHTRAVIDTVMGHWDVPIHQVELV